jgi:drug/metabolite transporter (DMT)-like permease
VPPVALGLVLTAALIHAGWNLLAKKAPDPAAFLFLATAAAALMGLPLAAFGVATGQVPAAAWAAIGASAVAEALYVRLLAAGYRRGDLSVVYPVARGSAPLLVALLAGPLLGEWLAPLGAAAVGLIGGGIALIAGGGLGRQADRRRAWAGVLLGVLVGACATAYSLIDRVGVALVPPFVYLPLHTTGAALLLAPGWLRCAERRRRLREACGAGPAALRVALVGAGMFGAYGLVLTAMRLAPVAYVVAGREIAIVFGAVLGAVVLREPVTPLRAAGAVVITAGVALLALGRP